MKNSIGISIFINKTRISNSFEKNNFYKKHPRANETQWIDVEDGIINKLKSYVNYKKFK